MSKEELSRWDKGEAGQWVCLFDTSLHQQVHAKKNHQVDHILSTVGLTYKLQGNLRLEKVTYNCSNVFHQEVNFVFSRNNDRLEKVSTKDYKHQKEQEIENEQHNDDENKNVQGCTAGIPHHQEPIANLQNVCKLKLKGN